jgi:hypothetical protein
METPPHRLAFLNPTFTPIKPALRVPQPTNTRIHHPNQFLHRRPHFSSSLPAFFFIAARTFLHRCPHFSSSLPALLHLTHPVTTRYTLKHRVQQSCILA